MEDKITAFISITTEYTTPENIRDQLLKVARVEWLYFVTGDYDYIMKIACKDMDELKTAVVDIRKIKGVKISNTSIILRKLTG